MASQNEAITTGKSPIMNCMTWKMARWPNNQEKRDDRRVLVRNPFRNCEIISSLKRINGWWWPFTKDVQNGLHWSGSYVKAIQNGTSISLKQNSFATLIDGGFRKVTNETEQFRIHQNEQKETKKETKKTEPESRPGSAANALAFSRIAVAPLRIRDVDRIRVFSHMKFVSFLVLFWLLLFFFYRRISPISSEGDPIWKAPLSFWSTVDGFSFHFSYNQMEKWWRELVEGVVWTELSIGSESHVVFLDSIS